MAIKPIPQTILNVANDPGADLRNRVDDVAGSRAAAGAAGATVADVVNVTVVNTTVTKINNPGGTDGDVQYNVAGVAFGGEDAFKYNPVTDTLTIAGNVVAAGFKYANGAPVGSGGSTANATYANTAGFAAQANVANTAMFAQSVNGANVIGTVGNAAVANVARSVDGANIVMPLANVSVTGTTNLGTAANLRIAGGASGQVLTALSNGNVAWTTLSGGGGGSSVAADIFVEPTGNIESTNVQDALVELDSSITSLQGNITTITTGLNGKVAKAGDTMTGGLVINNANLAAPSLRVRGGNVVFADQFAGNAFVFDIAEKTATVTGTGGVATITGSEIYANRYSGNTLTGSTGMGGGKVRLRDGAGEPSEPVEDDNAITKRYLNNRLANVSLSEITNTDDTNEFKVGVGTDGVVTMTTSRGSLEFGALPEPGGASHLHIMRPSGEESSSDVFFGDDFNYVKLPAAPDLGVEIGTGASPSSYTWRFDTDGTTQFPGYAFPATDGTDGQILVTDGAGTLSWADQSISTSAQWVASLNTAPADAAVGDRIFQVNGVRYDQEGNIIAIARHGFEEGGNNYASIVKMDQLGRVLWMNKLSDDVNIDGWSVEVDDNNNVFMIGTHRVMPNPFAILVKYDGTNGEGIWGKSLGRESGAYGFDIAVGPDNNPVISGYSEDVDGQDLMIAKFDGSTGENMWNKTMGVALSDERAYGVAVNPSNNEVTVVGHQITGTNALLVAKFAADGTPVWQKGLPYDNGARGTDVVVDASGNAYISGYFYGSSNPGPAILTLKLDSDGDVVWIREALGGCDDVGISIALGNDNDLYLCGTTGTLVEGAPVYRSIIVRYNATTGVPVWQRTFNHGSDWTFNFNFSEDNGPGSMIDVHGDSIVVGGGMVAIDNETGPIFSTARGYVTQLSRDNTLPTMGGFTVLASTIGGSLTSGTTGDTTLTITDDALTINTDEPSLNPGTVVVTVSYEDANYVSKDGGTMTGFLTLSADPTQDLHAATKAYVDDAIAGIGSIDAPPYRGFKAHYGRMFTDTPSITKLVIYRDTATSPTSNIDTDTSSDLFQVSGLTGSDFVALLNIYGSAPDSELSLEQLMTFMEAVVDNVILDGDGDINTVAVMKTNFYDNYAAISAVAGTLYEGFQFYSQNVSDLPTTVTSSVAEPIIAVGFRPNLQRQSNGSVTPSGWNNAGADYLVNDQVTIAGTSFQDGTSPANDVVLQIDAVDGVGGVNGYSVLSGTIPPQWPSNSIDDGGDDQYDTGNYITTDLASDISYNGGEVVADSEAEFGAGSSYVMTYNDSIFGLFATGVSISSIKTDGNSGFDGDGLADTGSLFNVVQTTVSQLVNGAHTLMLNGNGSVTLPDGPLLSGDEFNGVRIGFTDNDTDNGKVFQVRPGGDNYDHIHLDAANNGSFDLFLGDDARYVKNSRDGNIYISTDHNTNKTWKFGSDSTTAFPNYTFPAADGTDGQILVTDGEGTLNWTTKSDSGSWTLAVGTNTVSFTLPGPGAYSIWVSGNIPNGIVTYTATIVLSNSNVPVVGSSYGWFYADGGELELTAIPTQVVGTVNTISTASLLTTTANVFEFGIKNNTVSPQVVDWGYTKL